MNKKNAIDPTQTIHNRSVLRSLSIIILVLICIPILLVKAPSITYAQITPPITRPQQQQQQPTPFLPAPQTTFPPSVFPPTQSALPPTSFAVPTNPLSPWFLSAPAIACGGNFYLTITGETNSKHTGSKHSTDNNDDKNKNYNGQYDISNNGKQTIALQVIAPGGTDLDQNAVAGKIFVGQDNIDKNNAQKLSINSLINNCKSSTFQGSNNSDPATTTPMPLDTNSGSTLSKAKSTATTSSIAPSLAPPDTTTFNLSNP
ncbi:MAG: hypothetical protein ACJ71P_07640 [Nitrososphaeraceae archaeon]